MKTLKNNNMSLASSCEREIEARVSTWSTRGACNDVCRGYDIGKANFASDSSTVKFMLHKYK